MGCPKTFPSLRPLLLKPGALLTKLSLHDAVNFVQLVFLILSVKF